MTLSSMRQSVAENLGRLASDGSTVIDGIITSTGIDKEINRLYRDEVFSMLSDKFPEDFIQETEPIGTYEGPGVVDNASTGTTLIATAPIFKDSHVGITVYNATTNLQAKITVYTSSTQVTLDTTIGDTWDGATFYVLNNTFSFLGAATDLKEIMRIKIKYRNSESFYRTADRIFENTLFQHGSEISHIVHPLWSRTTETISNIMVPAVRLWPAPIHYDGKLIIVYIQKPLDLTKNDEPILTNSGVSSALIYGATAWGKRVLKDFVAAREFERLYKEQLARLIASYKPINRGRSSDLKTSSYFEQIKRRRF